MNDFIKKIKEAITANLDSIIKPTCVMVAIALVITAALSGANKLTEKRIAELSVKQQNETMSVVLKADEHIANTVTVDGVEHEYFVAKTDGQTIGYIFVTSEKGYGGDVSVMTAVTPDGKIKAVSILDVANETPGLGQNTAKEDFYSQFAGLSDGISVVKNGADSASNEINAVTGATISSKAVTGAVNKALKLAKTVISGTGSDIMKGKSIKILSIGNSFSEDTSEHMADIIKSLGSTDFKVANLYIGGCSIKRHYNNIVNDLSEYVYSENTGDGWKKTENFSIAKAIQSDNWDVISIQHGTGDGSRYTAIASYDDLPALVARVKELAGDSVKIAFNMAWVAEPESTHHEIKSYFGDQNLMYEKLTELTESVVVPTVDVVCPAGTAVQNARQCISKKLTRDDFHLSNGLGRYIAGMTFLKSVCDIDITAVTWCPDDVTPSELEIVKKSVVAAVNTPFAISNLTK